MSSSADPTRITYPEPPEFFRRGGLRGALRIFGPGAIIASVTIGSGETLFASRAGAIFEYALLWFILLCVACKLVQVYTGARYMTLTGEHPMEAWARLPGPRGWFPACLGALSVFCFPFWLGALSLMVGSAMNWVTGIETTIDDSSALLYRRLFGTGTLVLAVILTLIQTYKVFEKVQTAIVAVLLLAMLTAVVLADVAWGQVVRNLFTVSIPDYPAWIAEEYPDIPKRETVLLAMVTFMAAIGGGTYDYIGYLGFYREKGWGALGVAPTERPVTTAPQIETSSLNVQTGRQWLRGPMIDVFAGFGCVLVFTLVFYVLGASILHGEKLVPDKEAPLSHQVRFLTQFGRGFKYLYQVGIFMAFWGTIYGAFEIYSRTAYECFRPLVARVRSMSYARFRLPVCLYTGIGGLLLLWTSTDPIKIITPIAPVATLTCGIWCFAMIWADRRMLPAGLRMNGAWVVFNVLAGIVLTAFGGKAMFDTLAKLLA